MPLEFLQASSEDVIISDTAALDLSGDNTIMCWFKLGSGGAAIFTLFSKDRGTGGTIPYQSRINDGVTDFKIILTYGHTVGGEDNLNGINDAIVRGAFFHTALRLNGTTADIMLDGVVHKTETQDASGLVNSDGDFKIGKRISGSFMEGLIEDLRVYNRALSDNELKTIFAARGRDGIVNGLVGRWLMNEKAPGISPGATEVLDIGLNRLNSSAVGNTPTYEEGILSFRRKVV